MYAASIEGLTPAERATFNQALALRRSYRQTVTWSCRTCVHSAGTSVDAPPAVALPAASAERPALRSVPALSPDRISADRLAAIRSLGGDVSLGTGA